MDWILKNKEFLGIVTSFLGIILPSATLILAKNKEQKQLNFERFHKDLMKGLANLDGNIGLDQQVAIIYELRNYSDYYPLIRRLLLAQIERWNRTLTKNPQFEQLIMEANETIEFSKKNIIGRYIGKFFN